MSFIPIFKKPYPDELIYSWIHRLANENKLLIKDFSIEFLAIPNAKGDDIQYDTRFGFKAFCEHMLIKPDMKELYMSSTTLPFEAVWMTEGEQTKYINNVFANRSKLNTKANNLIKSINICQECLREDIENYGEGYIHRKHQLSNVCTCYKHHTPLMKFKGIKSHTCNYNLKEYEIINVKDVESENAYSVYVAKLLDAELNANIKDIKNILYEKLAEEGYTVDDEYKAFVENIGKWKYKELIQFDVRRFLKNKMIEATYISPREICSVLMFLYPNPDELISTIQKLNKEPTFQEYKCDTCGKTYVTTPYSYKLIGCNNCNEKLSENEVMKNILSNEGYEMINSFESISKKLECIHDKCGDKVFIKPRSFIYEEVRCVCEKNMTFAEAKKEIKSLGDYELLEYTSKDKVCKIHSGECGHTFDVRYRKFVKSPKCRICSPKTMTTDILSKRIKRQTNGEYELVGDFVSQDIKIRILHKPCGVITEYNPRYFYCGAVCPVCNNVYNDKWRDMYELLCEYNNKFGHVNIPKREKYKGYELGVWCCRQRQNYKNNKLSQNRIELLENINFIFDILEAEWCRRYEQYKRYIKEKGSTYIARRTDYEGEHLGAWVETQKKRYKQGKISDDRVERLMLLDENFFE